MKKIYTLGKKKDVTVTLGAEATFSYKLCNQCVIFVTINFVFLHHHITISSYQFDGGCRRPMDAIFVNALISNVCTYVVFPMAVSHCVIQVKFK